MIAVEGDCDLAVMLECEGGAATPTPTMLPMDSIVGVSCLLPSMADGDGGTMRLLKGKKSSSSKKSKSSHPAVEPVPLVPQSFTLDFVIADGACSVLDATYIDSLGASTSCTLEDGTTYKLTVLPLTMMTEMMDEDKKNKAGRRDLRKMKSKSKSDKKKKSSKGSSMAMPVPPIETCESIAEEPLTPCEACVASCLNNSDKIFIDCYGPCVGPNSCTGSETDCFKACETFPPSECSFCGPPP